eukprot:COSAG01_NODE_3236_length_6351_cov_4.282823_4_plen_72_part_00
MTPTIRTTKIQPKSPVKTFRRQSEEGLTRARAERREAAGHVSHRPEGTMSAPVRALPRSFTGTLPSCATRS